MRVVLCVPNTGFAGEVVAPLGLGYLASYLRSKANYVEVKIFDGSLGLNVEREIFMFQPHLVGISASTPQANDAYRLADTVMRCRKDIGVVIGGPHASAVPVEAIDHADWVVQGEGEEALHWIVDGDMPSLGIMRGVPVENLDDIPSPAFDLLDMKHYVNTPTGFPMLESPTASLVTSRGCPFKCPFCYNSSRSTKPRYFSAERVVEEVKFLVEKYHVKSILFHDDEFLVNTERLEEMATLFIKNGLNSKVKWGCKARVNTITPKTVRLLQAMGCVSVFLGLESGVQRVLNYLKCGTTTVSQAEYAIKLLDSHGVFVSGSLIFGSPDETFAEMKETVAWFKRQKGLRNITVNGLIPYPATQVYLDAKRDGLIPERPDWSKFRVDVLDTGIYLNRHVSKDKFQRFLLDTRRQAWLISQHRQGKTQYKTKTYWWGWLKHPTIMLEK